MKRNLLLLVLLTSLVCNVTADDAQNAKTEINAAQRKITQLITQKKSISGKIEKWNTDLQEAKSNVESLQDKPKSPALKTASKKVEDLDTKIKNAEIEIQQIDKSLDSLTNVISSKQQIIFASEEQKAKAKEEKIAAKEEKRVAKTEARVAAKNEAKTNKAEARGAAKDEAKSARTKTHKESMRDINATASVNAKTDYSKDAFTTHDFKSPTSAVSVITSAENNKHSSQETLQDNSSDKIGAWIMGIFFGFFALIHIRRRYHCPKCGKWFTMEFEGAARTRAESGEWVLRQRYRCSNPNCGHKKIIFSPLPKKN